MSALDRKKKVEHYAIENQQLRRVIGTLTMLNAELQTQVKDLEAENADLLYNIKLVEQVREQEITNRSGQREPVTGMDHTIPEGQDFWKAMAIGTLPEPPEVKP